MQMTEKKIIEQVPYPENLTRIILDKHDNCSFSFEINVKPT